MASKRVRSFENLVDKSKKYSLKEAIVILKKAPKTKFNESVDLAIKLDIDPKQSDQMVRGTVVLPHGTGKIKRVAVFCKGEAQHKAKEAGADHVGAEVLADQDVGVALGRRAVLGTGHLVRTEEAETRRANTHRLWGPARSSTRKPSGWYGCASGVSNARMRTGGADRHRGV